ncbi:MAG: TVP38/TMEM64 family protein [Acholeplasmatales bacterium]|nr:TVP38/TMEM64 family protein [Acholeplasmatales bacterium]
MNEDSKKKYKKIRIAIYTSVLLLIIAGLIFATIKLFPYFKRIQDDKLYREYIVEKLNSYDGLAGIIILLVQILQVILTVIPSGPIVIISGILFNPVIAIIICLVGQTIGSIIVYLLVKTLGYRFIALFFDPESIKNSKLLKNEVRCKVLMVGYMLIPGLPKDIIAFIAPFTKIKLKDFIIISFFGRLPMTIVTVLLGTSILAGSMPLAITLTCICILLALLCFIFQNKIINFLEKRGSKNEEKQQ